MASDEIHLFLWVGEEWKLCRDVEGRGNLGRPNLLWNEAARGLEYTERNGRAGSRQPGESLVINPLIAIGYIILWLIAVLECSWWKYKGYSPSWNGNCHGVGPLGPDFHPLVHIRSSKGLIGTCWDIMGTQLITQRVMIPRTNRQRTCIVVKVSSSRLALNFFIS